MKIIVLTGSTATGKTALAIRIAKALDCEIVSADSIQIYRGLDIGSAKPSNEELNEVRHHLIDVAEVSDGDFSVSRYKALADKAIEDIASRGKIPLITGGTGLYINSLTFPLNFACVPPDERIRASLSEQEHNTPGSLYKRLLEVDPARANQLHPNDTKRVMRALEVYMLSGRTHTSFGEDFKNTANAQPPYDAVQLGLAMDRAYLYSRIEARVDAMMKQGLLDEVRRYADYPPELPALQGLGYKQLLAYLREEMELEEAISTIKKETRHYAKRQWTWFKRDERIKWFDAADGKLFEEAMSHLANEGFCTKQLHKG